MSAWSPFVREMYRVSSPSKLVTYLSLGVPVVALMEATQPRCPRHRAGWARGSCGRRRSGRDRRSGGARTEPAAASGETAVVVGIEEFDGAMAESDRRVPTHAMWRAARPDKGRMTRQLIFLGRDFFSLRPWRRSRKIRAALCRMPRMPCKRRCSGIFSEMDRQDESSKSSFCRLIPTPLPAAGHPAVSEIGYMKV